MAARRDVDAPRCLRSPQSSGSSLNTRRTMRIGPGTLFGPLIMGEFPPLRLPCDPTRGSPSSPPTGSPWLPIAGPIYRTFDPLITGDTSSTMVGTAATVETAFGPLIIGEVPQQGPPGAHHHLRPVRLGASVPSSLGRSLNHRRVRDVAAGELPSVPSSSGRYLNSIIMIDLRRNDLSVPSSSERLLRPREPAARGRDPGVSVSSSSERLLRLLPSLEDPSVPEFQSPHHRRDCCDEDSGETFRRASVFQSPHHRRDCCDLPDDLKELAKATFQSPHHRRDCCDWTPSAGSRSGGCFSLLIIGEIAATSGRSVSAGRRSSFSLLIIGEIAATAPFTTYPVPTGYGSSSANLAPFAPRARPAAVCTLDVPCRNHNPGMVL